ncbi:multiple sugar transport system substrate-binding protein [Terribacillus halophilus]|uniref:Multiple sugar transport system substrate-binding protein n=1 Tax=Terribacillus halophilus TaxID=361279 RepID=A0A1G6U0C7_9BACI|nr:extracellular solute-binding protein [Terribacillus halophilus]SDD34761.1 multiple sugar transport system substrate-binding protein [Terribacillus halophilus]
MWKSAKGICLFMLIFILVTMAACSSNTESPDGKKELTVVYRSPGSVDSLKKFFDSGVVDEFEKEHPDIDVKIAPITASEGDYFSKVALQMKSAETAPDVVSEDTFMLNSDANAGYLEPLDDRISDWDEWGNIIENLKSGVTAEDGKVYGVPSTSDSRGLWYSKELFQEAGLPVPWEPKNWNDVLDAAITIKEKTDGVTPLFMQVGKANGEAVSMQTLEMLLYGTGDTLYDETDKKWVVDSPGLLDSFRFIEQVYNKENLGPDFSVVMSGQSGNVAFQQLFPQKKLAIALDGSWNARNWAENGAAPIENVEEKIGFAPMPTQEGQDPGTITMSGGWAWAIPSKADMKEEAWEFIQFLMEKENSISRSLTDGNLNTRTDAVEVEAYVNRPYAKEAQAFLENAQFRPANDKYPAVSTQLQTVVEAVATGKLSPDDAVEQYKAGVERVVGKENTKVAE